MEVSLIPSDRYAEFMSFPEQGILCSARNDSGTVSLQTPQGTLDVQVPRCWEARYPGDRNIFGHVVQYNLTIPPSSQRFYHPTLCSDALDHAAAMGQDPRDLEPNWRFRGWWDAVREAAWGVLSDTYVDRQRRQRLEAVIRGILTGKGRWVRAFKELPEGAPEEYREIVENPTNIHEDYQQKISGLPLVTGPADLLKLSREIKAGYHQYSMRCPDFLELQEYLQARYVKALQFCPETGRGLCEPLMTGKQDSGRILTTVQPGDPLQPRTGRPIPEIQQILNPGAHLGVPIRPYQENRTFPSWLRLSDARKFPLQWPGQETPECLRDRTTALVVAILDIPGLNTYDVGGKQKSLDCLLVTPAGRKLLAYTEQQTVEVSSDEPGAQHVPEFLGTLGQLTLWGHHWTAQQTRQRCELHGKLKCTVGGIKGVTAPVQQLYGENGLEIHVVIAADTVRSKAAIAVPIVAVDALLEHLSGRTRRINPRETPQQAIRRIQRKLVSRGMDPEGLQDITARSNVEGPKDCSIAGNLPTEILEALQVRQDGSRVIGRGVVGMLPFCLAPETAQWQSSFAGLSMSPELRVPRGIPVLPDQLTGQRFGEFAELICSL